ncbi:hypothetical protein DL96DRAFT_1631285 [Flagelloscypha sp. PMI_526]|nr:hypothetical protein DL96DRAFT_1631285 [Flagelloscypha sp. PMI_526]
MPQHFSPSFSSIPFDVMQEVFEHAAFFGKEDCHSLSLVSRAVQRCIDPYLFTKIIITSLSRAEKLLEAIALDKSFRFTRALSFVQVFATTVSDHRFTWDWIVLHFPGLVVLHMRGHHDGNDFYEGVEDPTTVEPALLPTLRRLGGGYGWSSFRGSWLCVQTLTHLEIVGMSSSDWLSLESRGLRMLSRLTHLACDLDCNAEIETMRQHLLVMSKNVPPSLLVCLINVEAVHKLDERDCIVLLRFTYELDDRFVLCSWRHAVDFNVDLRWFLSASLLDDFDEWAGRCHEKDTYWVQGLELVNERREKVDGGLPTLMSDLHMVSG